MRAICLLLYSAALIEAQPFDLVLKGGHVIDPANGIDGVMDVAVSGGRIAAVRADIPAGGSKTIDVSGLHVVPGLVDLHFHAFGYEGALFPDDTALPTGSTTVVDAGGSGWRTFEAFRRDVVGHSRTRVLALINIVGAGMVGEPAERNTADMDSAKTAETILRNRDVIVGIKTAHFGGQGWTAIDRAVEAGRLAKVPVMVDDKIFTNTGRTTREKLLDHLRPGDIHTHMYNDRQIELLDRFTGKVQPYMVEARQRGVKFDLGHGAGSFLWPVATKAMAQGFAPDSISTDLHAASILGPQSDMPNAMSKMMLLGMSMQDAVLRATVNPAKQIGRYPEMGTLSVGSVADIAVLELCKGAFAFKDAWGAKRLGTARLENVLTIREGKLVYDRGGPAFTSSNQQIYDILLKNGNVVDPVNHRTGRMDVAVNGSKIARVAADLPAAHARVSIDAGRYYVAPGLIEVDPFFHGDYNTLPYGVTSLLITGAQPSTRGMKTRLLVTEPRAPASGVPLSEMLRAGLTIEQLVERFAVTPARQAHHPELGSLSEGAVADIALFESDGRRMRCVLTIRNGAIVWDGEGLSAIDWIRAGPYTNFK